MKIQKVITLDVEIGNRLKKEENASGLINELLKDYYKIRDEEELPLLERRKRLEISKIELEAMKKIQKIKNGSL